MRREPQRDSRESASQPTGATVVRSRVVQRATGGLERGSARAMIPRRPANDVAPASLGQEQIWLHGLLAPDTPLYTESVTIRYRGLLDREAMTASFFEVVRRHEAWRTTFESRDGQLVQRVHADMRPRLIVEDLRDLPVDAREPAALALAATDLRAPFDLSRELGVRARLVTLADRDHRLFLCLHHLVFDGISIYGVCLPELATIYAATVASTRVSLDEPPLQYADYAHWQCTSGSSATSGETGEALVAYWRRQLAGAPPTIALPVDHPRPLTQSFRGGLVRFEHAAPLTARLRTTAREEQCTMFMALLTGFAIMLHSRSGQTDMVIGTVSGGRDRPELDRVIGYFLRSLPLRIDLRGDPSFREILWRVRETLIDALCHDTLPFQQLVRAVVRDRDLGRSPLYQVTFSIEPPLRDVGPEWDVSEMDAGTAVSKFDLSIELDDRGETIRGRAIYAVDLFDASTIAAMMGEWTRVLEDATSDPGRPLRAFVDTPVRALD